MSVGTLLFTWWRGKLVGTDQDGNRYYIERKARPGLRQRRWVLFKGKVEATRIAPEWHAWLHYTVGAPIPVPADKPWVKPQAENATGTPGAYLPAGHDRRGGVRAAATGDYQAWQP